MMKVCGVVCWRPAVSVWCVGAAVQRCAHTVGVQCTVHVRASYAHTATVFSCAARSVQCACVSGSRWGGEGYVWVCGCVGVWVWVVVRGV